MDYIYSIIIPHKNIPDLLTRCLDSIPKREDTQIIIVDDNSNPTIVDFNNFPGIDRQNTEIVFSKEGKGAGYARNLGLSKVRNTKWIIFADSDDFFSDNFNSKLDLYSNSDADLIFFQMDSVDTISLKPSNRKDFRNNKFFKAIKDNDQGILKYKMYGPTTKFISYKLIKNHNIIFEEVKAANDVMFSVKVGHYANNIITDKDILYVVTEREDSLVNTISYENLECRFFVTIRLNKYLTEINAGKYRSLIFNHIYTFFKLKPIWGLRYFFIYLKNTPIKYLLQDIVKIIIYKN